MTDLSTRIMDMWLERNPEPEEGVVEQARHRHKFYHLRNMVSCQAYESAVIQFLVPEGWGWFVTSSGEDDTPQACITSPLDHDEDGGCKDYTSRAASEAEALLNAIEAINEPH